MLAYRHDYHAGNHADVLKHAVWLHVLRHLLRKPKPFSVVDTHAGPGIYDLSSEHAQKKAEHLTGFERVAAQADPPALIAAYLESVRAYRGIHGDTHYPGSTALTLAEKREIDRAVFFELHPTDFDTLTKTLNTHRHVARFREDGFRGLLAHLPPTERRGAVIIDPSYELKSDYEEATTCLIRAHRKFSSGVFVLWYPVVDRHRVDALLHRITSSVMRKVARLELCVAPDTDVHGMTGSGLVVVNPPYTLLDEGARALPWLCEKLGQRGSSVCEWLVGQ